MIKSEIFVPDETEFSQIFNNSFNGFLLWNYHTNSSQESFSCIRLVSLAEKKRWSPYLDIDWPPDTLGSRFPCADYADPFAGFDQYEKLSRPDRLRVAWQRHAMEISELLHGEQLALMCASQLISMMPCMESRLFASTQVADEARHVEFFRRYLASAGLDICGPSPALRHLTVDTLQDPRWEIKLLICQILIESLALAQFSHLAQAGVPPTLKQGLRRIMDDEARHVRFGTDYLKSLFRSHNAEQLTGYGNYVIDKAFELASSDNQCLAIARDHQWDIHKLRQHLRQQRIGRPELIRQRFRQLSLNIKAIGLMNASIEERIMRFTGT
ncbi:MAG: ferritin-like domain-containing protein [Pseudohongiella sp.]|nr:ferritin-like domain-containing protein [Pseudohongiella sp.]